MPINNSQALASGNTSITTTTYTDISGCSLSLSAGTWLVLGQASLSFGSTDTGYLKVYNSTDAIDYATSLHSVETGFALAAAPSCIITLAGTKTIKMAAKKNGVNYTVLQFADGTIPSTRLLAIQLA